jgi:DNA ligase 3
MASSCRFGADYSKRASKCKRCKKDIEKGGVRLFKVVPSFFGDADDEMRNYFHIECIFDSFKRAKATTKVIESTEDIDDFKSLKEEHKKMVIKELESSSRTKKKPTTSKESKKPDKEASSDSNSDSGSDIDSDSEDMEQFKKNLSSKLTKSDEKHDDNTFKTFQQICSSIANESGHLKKAQILRTFFKSGSTGNGYKGDMYTFIKLLLPSQSTTRVYNLNSNSLIKIYSQIFHTDSDQMSDHLNKTGDISDTCAHYFSRSNSSIKPATNSTLTISQIDAYLDKLTQNTKEKDQIKLLEEITKKLTKHDLKVFIRLIKKDLRIDAGAKNVLDAVAPNAYQAFQTSRNLKDVIDRCINLQSENENNKKTGKPTLNKVLSIHINVMSEF